MHNMHFYILHSTDFYIAIYYCFSQFIFFKTKTNIVFHTFVCYRKFNFIILYFDNHDNEMSAHQVIFVSFIF